MLLTVDPDGTERVLSTRWQLDPTGATTLDAWQPSKEGDLLAYQLSEGGTEESVLRVMDVATGELVDGPIDRARYSPVAWLPGGEAYYYVRRLDPPTWCPTTRRSSTAGSGCTGSAPTRPTTSRSSATGLDTTNYYGVSVSPRRPLAASSARPPAPRRATTCGSPTCPRRPARGARAASRCRQGVDAQTVAARSAATAGSTCSPTATPPAAGSR